MVMRKWVVPLGCAPVIQHAVIQHKVAADSSDLADGGEKVGYTEVS
jgi:hypothetical protein